MTSLLVLFALLWLGAMLTWWAITRALRSSEVNRIQARVSQDFLQKSGGKRSVSVAPVLIPKEDKGKGRFVVHLLERFHLSAQVRQLLEQAGLKWHTARFVNGSLALLLGGFVIARLALPASFRQIALPAGVLCGLGPLSYVLRKRKTRLGKFEEQFPESLEFVSRSMRAGHAFSVSLEMLHREFEDPLAAEFRRTFDEHNLGLPLDTALEKLARRVPLMDVQFFVSAVMLQKRTGGNLAELLDKLAYVIRERFKLRGRIRAVSAHGRMTGAALSTIPIVVALMMFFVNRDYVAFFFTDPTGKIMIGCAAALQVIGYGVIRKIVAIEV